MFYAAVLLIAFLAYQIVEPFLAQIGWAVVLAICIAPPRSGWRGASADAQRGPADASGAVLLILPAMLAVRMLVREGAQLAAYVEGQLRDRGGPMGLFHIAWDWLRARLPFLPTEDEIIEKLASSVGGLASQVAGHAAPW